MSSATPAQMLLAMLEPWSSDMCQSMTSAHLSSTALAVVWMCLLVHCLAVHPHIALHMFWACAGSTAYLIAFDMLQVCTAILLKEQHYVCHMLSVVCSCFQSVPAYKCAHVASTPSLCRTHRTLCCCPMLITRSCQAQHAIFETGFIAMLSQLITSRCPARASNLQQCVSYSCYMLMT